MDAKQILDREFLVVRAKILEIAASLDRIGRANGDVGVDPNLQLLLSGIGILATDTNNRAERVQVLFSDEYQDNWQTEFEMTPRT